MAATHAPDTAAMTAAQSKIIECSTGDFGAQASLYASVLAEAYQAADVTVQVSDMRAAVERHNADGSFEILVAVRVKITNSETADQDVGYRLRVTDGAGRRHLQGRQDGTGHVVVTAVLDTADAPATEAAPELPAGGLAARGRVRSPSTFWWASR